MIGWSADGDSRLLRAMKIRTKFDLTPSVDVLNHVNIDTFINVQDTTHLGAKIKNRLLNVSIVLYMGTRIVTVSHLNRLVDTVPKEIHGLVKSDIFTDDRQNYRAVEKLMDERVLRALEDNIVDSEATIHYLKLCQNVTSSYLEDDLPILERISRMWYANYFFRAWRKWLSTHDEYSVNENFISNNAYNCVEINAHALIELIIKLRNAGETHLFIPSLFSSQPCEQIFRTMRSMGTCNYTKINFSLHELFHLISRVEITQKIIKSHKDVTFPRDVLQSEINKEADTLQFPTNLEIVEAMKNARSKALDKARQFGIVLNAEDITNTELQFSRERIARSLITNIIEPIDDISDEEDEELNELACDENAANSSTQSKSDIMVDIIESDGSKRTIRKSTFLWMLADSKDKLSSDRSMRVRGSSSQNLGPPGKKQKTQEKTIDIFNNEVNILKSDAIKIGDWVLIKTPQSISNLENKKGHLIGNIIGFRHIDDKGRPKQFKTRHVPTITDPNEASTEMLAVWYVCKSETSILKQYNGKLLILKEQYLGTIKPPVVKKDSSETRKINYSLEFAYSEIDKFLNQNIESGNK